MAKGSFKIDLSDLHYRLDKFVKTLDDPSGVFTKTMSDMRSRAPGKIADVVRTQYNIKKADIMPSKTKTDLKRAGSIKVTGGNIAEFEIKYEGRRLSPLHFGMQPKTLPKNKKYKISQKVKKTKEILQNPDAKGYVPFLAPAAKGSSRIIPFQRQADSRDIEKAFKTIAVPEMIGPNEEGKGGNPVVIEGIKKEVGDLLEKRFNYHMDRFLDKAVK